MTPYPHLTDLQIAHRVRMLCRSDLDHEPLVQAARDRIVALVAENDKLRDALEKLTRIYESEQDLGDPPVSRPAWLSEALTPRTASA